MPTVYDDGVIKINAFEGSVSKEESGKKHYFMSTHKKMTSEELTSKFGELYTLGTLAKGEITMPSASELERAIVENKEYWDTQEEKILEMPKGCFLRQEENAEEEGSTMEYPTACASASENGFLVGAVHFSETNLPGEWRVLPKDWDKDCITEFKPFKTQKEMEEFTKELTEGGYKADSQKLRMDLIPPEIMEGLAKALTYGANKYTPRNFEKGMDWGRVFGAAMRHLWAFWRGEEFDQESGLHHLESALFSIGALYVYVKRNIGKDDRGTH